MIEVTWAECHCKDHYENRRIKKKKKKYVKNDWGSWVSHEFENRSRMADAGNDSRRVNKCCGCAPYCWAMMKGMVGLSERSDAALSPVRLLNMGSVDRGGGKRRFPAMSLSSSVFPWMVWWWYSWILQQTDVLCFFCSFGMSWACIVLFLLTLTAIFWTTDNFVEAAFCYMQQWTVTQYTKNSFEVGYLYLSATLFFYSATFTWQHLLFRLRFYIKHMMINAKMTCVKSESSICRCTYWFVLAFLFSLSKKKEKCVTFMSQFIRSNHLLKGSVHHITESGIRCIGCRKFNKDWAGDVFCMWQTGPS